MAQDRIFTFKGTAGETKRIHGSNQFERCNQSDVINESDDGSSIPDN